ncbi:hypothetical protein A2U01_0089566, partial [Trifolium medium]|nr:hypothetical protein [Trifolium medium]
MGLYILIECDGIWASGADRAYDEHHRGTMPVLESG